MERTLQIQVKVKVDAYLLLLQQACQKDQQFAQTCEEYFSSGGRTNGLFGTWLEHQAQVILSK